MGSNFMPKSNFTNEDLYFLLSYTNSYRNLVTWSGSYMALRDKATGEFSRNFYYLNRPLNSYAGVFGVADYESKVRILKLKMADPI